MAKRFERQKCVSVQLTARDLEIVVAVYEARYLTNRQIGQLFYGREGSSSCRQRLRYLFDLDYLRKRVAGPNEPDIYYLGLQGRRYVASLGPAPQEEVDRVAGVSGGNVPTPALMMQHELTLSRLYVNARLECRERSWAMQWKNARRLEMENLGIQPDAWLEVQERRQAFIEFTAAMPTVGELRDKTRLYEAYWERTRQAVPLLWLTTSRHRLTQIRAVTRASLYPDYYLLGLIEDAGHFLTTRMWHWSEAEEMIQWVKPPEEG